MKKTIMKQIEENLTEINRLGILPNKEKKHKKKELKKRQLNSYKNITEKISTSK